MKKIDILIKKDQNRFNKLDDIMIKRISKKTKAKIKQAKVKNIINSLVAILVISFIVLAAIPNTPVNAFLKKTFSFIPGVGVIEQDDNQEITSILIEPVTYEKEELFLDIYAAYIQGNILTIKVESNIYNEKSEEVANKLQTSSFEDVSSDLYLYVGTKKIKASMIWGSEGIFEASFLLEDMPYNNEIYTIGFTNANLTLNLTMTTIQPISDKDLIANWIIADDIIFFANMERVENDVSIIISHVTSRELEHLTYEWLDYESELFSQSVHVIDEHGNIYEPMERPGNINRYRNTFFFDIPITSQQLQLVIPQVLYTQKAEKDVIVSIPKLNQIKEINEVIDNRAFEILLNQLQYEIVNNKGNLKIDISGKDNQIDDFTIIRRVVPWLLIRQNIFSDFIRTSQSVHADIWRNQQGVVNITYEDIKEKDKVKILFTIDYAYTKDITIQLP